MTVDSLEILRVKYTSSLFNKITIHTILSKCHLDNLKILVYVNILVSFCNN